MAIDKISATQVLFPVSLLSFVMFLFLGFQTTLLVTDHSGLLQARDQQDKALEQVAKIKNQVNVLAVGTLKLSQSGNKDAQNIIAEMKKNGVDVSDQPNPPALAPGMTPPPPPGMTPPGMPPQ